MKLLTTALLALLFSSAAFADPCFGPGGCDPTEPTGPNGPAQLCIASVCAPVVYSWTGNIAVAESTAPSGYQVIGWSGPCGYTDRTQCPDIFNQAFADLRTNALRAHRAQRY